jgi:hypothetical protein
MYLWPNRGESACDVPRAVEEMASLGVEFVIAMAGMDSEHWIHPLRPRLASLGLDVSIGFGMDGAWTDAHMAVCRIIEALDAHAGFVDLDDERAAKWESKAGRALAGAIADGVLAARPDARPRMAQAGWWAPFSDHAGHPTHPGAPHHEWARLCATQRPQCYGAPRRGSSAAMLAWSRNASQYPTLGYDRAAILPTFQAYQRDVIDHVATLTADPEVILWDFLEMDLRCRAALLAVKVLRANGFTGPSAVAEFQKAAGLHADNACGEHTCGALGVAWPG